MSAVLEVPIEAAMWLGSQDTGLSSEAIWHHMVRGECDGSNPWDPADLGRCLRLLDRVPEWKPRIGEMARYSDRWAGLVKEWDRLRELMDSECGIGPNFRVKSAPLTYAAMQRAMGEKP
jgi:hypothetical protein